MDLLHVTPVAAKRDERLKTSGSLVASQHEGKDYPLLPKSVLYDDIYVNVLLENPGLAEELTANDAFADIEEFNPGKRINCQARAAAIFVSFHRQHLLDRVGKFDDLRRCSSNGNMKF